MKYFANCEELKTLHETSKVALGSIARIVVDIARSFNKNAPGLDVETFPPRCSHLVRAAMHLHSTSQGSLEEDRLTDLDELKTMLKTLHRRWSIAGKALSMQN